jgi:hypothetical protein
MLRLTRHNRLRILPAATPARKGLRKLGALSAISALSALLSLAALGPVPAAAAGRFFQPEAGFTSGRDLPPDFRARVRSIRFDRRDAFEGSVAHTAIERQTFHLGNDLHILSRETTLRRRLQFAEGGEINKDMLAENERALRAEEFLSDAIISAGPIRDGECDVVVTTFDQWTIAPVIGASPMNVSLVNLLLLRWDKLARDEWLWSAGIFESNLAGTGTKLGGAYRHTLERNARELVFSNGNLTSQHLQIAAYAALRSDGDSLYLRIAKPLLSRADKYAYALALTSVEASERIYFDANRLDDLPAGLAGQRADSANVARLFNRVGYQEILASATRSYGSDLKFNLGPTFRFRDHYNLDTAKTDTALSGRIPLPASADAPYAREDALLGASIGVYRYAYRTLRNFRNLKWNESVETGWRLNAGAALNQEWLGAGDHGFPGRGHGRWPLGPVGRGFLAGASPHVHLAHRGLVGPVRRARQHAIDPGRIEWAERVPQLLLLRPGPHAGHLGATRLSGIRMVDHGARLLPVPDRRQYFPHLAGYRCGRSALFPGPRGSPGTQQIHPENHPAHQYQYAARGQVPAGPLADHSGPEVLVATATALVAVAVPFFPSFLNPVSAPPQACSTGSVSL